MSNVKKWLVAILLSMAALTLSVGLASAQTNTPTVTVTSTVTSTATLTQTPTFTVTASSTPTPTITVTSTVTSTSTATPTFTPFPAATPRPGPSEKRGSSNANTSLIDVWNELVHRLNVTAFFSADNTGGASHGVVRNANSTPAAYQPVGGNIYGINIINTSGAAAFVQFHDAAPTAIAIGTRTPDYEVWVGSGSAVTVPVPAVGIQFSNAITVYSTTGEAGVTGSASGVIVYLNSRP